MAREQDGLVFAKGNTRMKAINTIAEIDADGWLNIRTRIPERIEAGPVEAIIVLQSHTIEETGHITPQQRNTKMDSLKKLRKLPPIAQMKDPVAWQRSAREDRVL
jgi:hypothetical protein